MRNFINIFIFKNLERVFSLKKFRVKIESSCQKNSVFSEKRFLWSYPAKEKIQNLRKKIKCSETRGKGSKMAPGFRSWTPLQTSKDLAGNEIEKYKIAQFEIWSGHWTRKNCFRRIFLPRFRQAAIFIFAILAEKVSPKKFLHFLLIVKFYFG